jgi:hypothetical protein
MSTSFPSWPVQHRLVQPSPRQVGANSADLIDVGAKDLVVERRPGELPSGPTIQPSSDAPIE